MSTRYKEHFSSRRAKQEEELVGAAQIKNSDGFYVFEASGWKQLDRFLILGSEGGSYYACEKSLTVENAKNVLKCIEEDGPRVVARIVEISKAGRAAKNDPALFALAMCAKLGDEETRRAAYLSLTEVARIPTHLFHFIDFVRAFGGWGRGLRRAVADWYTSRQPEKLAYHMVKYQSRDGWSNRDLLRLCHAVPQSTFQSRMFEWVVKEDKKGLPKGLDDFYSFAPEEQKAARFIDAFEQAKRAEDVSEVVNLITDFDLPREAIPTHFLKERDVWAALLTKMPMGALVRNLGNMSKVELLKPFEQTTKEVIARLTNPQLIKGARLHPLNLLMAHKTYKVGRGMRGSSSWDVVPGIVDALEEAFYLSFDAVEPAGKNHLLCLDTSYSMKGASIAGMGISAREASAVMAMVTARTEENSLFIAYSDKASEMEITRKWTLDAVIQRLEQYPAMYTDCAAPIEKAIERKYDVDTIILYTDSETNARGKRQPVVALRDLRQKLGHDVKFIVVGMVSNRFSVADPKDNSMLDVVGFDTAAPQIISKFSAGEI